MKTYIFLALIFFTLGALIAGIYFDHQTDVLIQREQLKTQNALLNVQYSEMTYDQDVGLLKKENHTLRLSCDP